MMCCDIVNCLNRLPDRAAVRAKRGERDGGPNAKGDDRMTGAVHAARFAMRAATGRGLSRKSLALIGFVPGSVGIAMTPARHQRGMELAVRQLLTTEAVSLSAAATADVPPSRSTISEAVSMTVTLRYA